MSKRPTKIPVPKVGDDVYIPTALYLSHGADDFSGGLCQISHVEEKYDVYWIRTVERPGTQYSWKRLAEKQAEYAERYGSKRGFPDPDNDPEFNRWD